MKGNRQNSLVKSAEDCRGESIHADLKVEKTGNNPEYDGPEKAGAEKSSIATGKKGVSMEEKEERREGAANGKGAPLMLCPGRQDMGRRSRKRGRGREGHSERAAVRRREEGRYKFIGAGGRKRLKCRDRR